MRKDPGATGGLDLESDVISEIAKHPNVCGVKLTCGNVGKLTRVAAAVAAPGFAKSYPRKAELLEGEDPFVVFGGFTDFLVPSIAARAHGAITGLANLAPVSSSLRSRVLSLDEADSHPCQAVDLTRVPTWRQGNQCTKRTWCR